MYKVKKASRFNFLLSLLFCLFLCIGIIMYPQNSTEGALAALQSCASVLIPSLFPFMFLSQFFVYSSVASKISPIFGKITRVLFKLPAVSGITVFLSLTGGYPVGAKGIITLYEQGELSKEQARRMSYFCVGGGPAFIMGTVGTVLLRNSTAGLIIFVSQALAAIIIGIFLSFFAKAEHNAEIKTKTNGTIDFSRAITTACKDASGAMLTMCALVILFGAVIELLATLGVADSLSSIFEFFGISTSISKAIPAIIFEVTAACRASALLGVPTEIVAFAIGFGGLCVHFQIYSFLEALQISKLKFTLCRIIQGILTSVFTYILFIFFPSQEKTALIFGKNVEVTSSGTIFAAVSLVLMTCIFAVSLKNNNKYLKG